MSEGVHEPASLWRTRVIWAAIGAGVTAWVMGARLHCVGPESASEPAPVVAGVEVPPDESSPAVDSADRVEPSPGTEGADGRASNGEPVDSETSVGVTSTSGALSDSSATTEGEWMTGSEDGATVGGETEGAALPSIPLPRMPGTRFMRQVRRPNDDGNGWLITQGLSIPAPGVQVEGFYRSALKKEGLKVFGGGRKTGAVSEGYRGALKGRGKRASVEVTIHQRPDKLRTVVRIYWKTRA